jgi:DNA repair protein RecO (recombination protein O)
MCDPCRRAQAPGASWELSAASRAIAAEMLRKPVAEAPPAAWSQETGADLRRFLVQQIEAHIERRLLTAAVLEASG